MHGQTVPVPKLSKTPCASHWAPKFVTLRAPRTSNSMRPVGAWRVNQTSRCPDPTPSTRPSAPQVCEAAGAVWRYFQPTEKATEQQLSKYGANADQSSGPQRGSGGGLAPPKWCNGVPQCFFIFESHRRNDTRKYVCSFPAPFGLNCLRSSSR